MQICLWSVVILTCGIPERVSDLKWAGYYTWADAALVKRNVSMVAKFETSGYSFEKIHND